VYYKPFSVAGGGLVVSMVVLNSASTSPLWLCSGLPWTAIVQIGVPGFSGQVDNAREGGGQNCAAETLVEVQASCKHLQNWCGNPLCSQISHEMPSDMSDTIQGFISFIRDIRLCLKI
jgi:hypothetical protein